MGPVLKRHELVSLFAFTIGCGAAALGLALKLDARLEADPAAIFAVMLAVLLAAAFLRAAARRRDLLTLTFSASGGEVRVQGRIATWRWSDVTELVWDADQLLFESALLTVEVPLKLFQNHGAVSEYMTNAVPEAEGSAAAQARLAKRIWVRTYGPTLVFAIFLFCVPVYMDFACRVLVDCGVPAHRAWAGGGLIVLGASIAKLWLEAPWCGAATLGCSLYFAVVAGIQRPLYLDAGLWRVTALSVALLGVGCGIAFWVVWRMERRASPSDRAREGPDRRTHQR